MKNMIVLAITAALLAGGASGQSGTGTSTSELGAAGEIPQWLVLAYIPVEAKPDAWEKVMNADLLASAGGEAFSPKVQPQGGQKLTLPLDKALKLPDAQLTWRLVRTSAPEIYSAWTTAQGVNLFNVPAGNEPRSSAAYLYCQLLAPSDMDAHLMLGTDGSTRNFSIKVLLNGQTVFRSVGSHWPGQDIENVKVKLRKGPNDVLVRVDDHDAATPSWGYLCVRLLQDGDAVPREVKVQIGHLADAPLLEEVRTVPSRWDKLLSDTAPLPPAQHEDLLGAHLSRTMSLLETGGQTGRPVRILIYGQSIEGQEWTTTLIRRLRERYPNTKIEAVNMAIGGWNVWRLMKTMYHDVVRERPDLVTFSAYGGWDHHWERVLSNLRRETCADIMIRTEHVAGWDAKNMETIDNDATILFRALAQKYDCELVDCRREWIGYIQAHNLKMSDLLDPTLVHVNDKGNALMAQLYERHFRTNTLTRSGWMNTVRRYAAVRAFEDRRFDEITLAGDGWKDVITHTNSAGADYPDLVESSSPKDRLKLKFVGNRLDLVLPSCAGGARILIDGKAPSTLGLLHGTRPMRMRTAAGEQPANIKRYYEGSDIVPETWTLTFLDVSGQEPTRTFRFKLSGSVTGPDGEGSSEKDFVSKSGRITIWSDDWVKDFKWEPRGLPPVPLTWQIVRDSLDEVHGSSQARPYTYVTVADGLPCVEHELTLIPLGDAPFRIQGVDVFKPPMAGK
jgi:hypothetical protein